MDKDHEDLVKEIRELREEIRQMKEIVGVLFSMITEAEDEEEGIGLFPNGMEIPRMNN
ncbi:MAG: hypothetical protein HPY73_03650 [Methanomassiliicoccales archaeon]|nr:MAG: hypothetical protein HPY73_03650 [Methanomassiliicoccales archaeon]